MMHGGSSCWCRLAEHNPQHRQLNEQPSRQLYMQ